MNTHFRKFTGSAFTGQPRTDKNRRRFLWLLVALLIFNSAAFAGHAVDCDDTQVTEHHLCDSSEDHPHNPGQSHLAGEHCSHCQAATAGKLIVFVAAVPLQSTANTLFISPPLPPSQHTHLARGPPNAA